MRYTLRNYSTPFTITVAWALSGWLISLLLGWLWPDTSNVFVSPAQIVGSFIGWVIAGYVTTGVLCRYGAIPQGVLLIIACAWGGLLLGAAYLTVGGTYLVLSDLPAGEQSI